MTSPTTYWIRGARHAFTGEPFEVAFRGETIVAAGRDLTGWIATADATAAVVDAAGATLAPGLVDVHVHLREPGQSGKETIATGTRAAAAGGFTSILCMPNTEPVVDSAMAVEWVLARAREAGHCRVHPIAAVTLGQQGEQLTDFGALREAGAVALSDDGRPIVSADRMRRALEHARPLGLPIIAHEEDPTLRGDGCMNEGAVSLRLGLAGLPNAAESVMIRRDIELAELTGGKLHVAHVSCAESVAALRDAKRRGLDVTSETCPHYWTLTEDAVGEWDTNAKMNPPLRTERDRRAIVEAIADGTIDVLATDHAPHQATEKNQPFDAAPFGIVGLETALALTITHLVDPGHISLSRALELWTRAPRRRFGLPAVELEVGDPADLVLIRPEETWTVTPDEFESKGRNTPFAGARVRGRVLATVCAGRFTHRAPELAVATTAAHAPTPVEAGR